MRVEKTLAVARLSPAAPSNIAREETAARRPDALPTLAHPPSPPPRSFHDPGSRHSMSDRRNFLRKSLVLSILHSAAAPRVARADADRPRRKIKLGQIGVGHAHATKLGVYRKSDDYEVVGIVEPDERLRAAAARQPVFRDLPWMTRDQLLDTPGLDAVLVETRVADLLDHAAACIAAGKHVHLDKPAGASLPRFRELLAAAERRRLLVQLGYMYRYNPGIVLLRRLLADGWLGELFELQAVMSKVIDDGTRTSLAEFSGGVMFELGCHLIDLTVGLLGAPEQTVPFMRHSGRQDDRLQDNMLAVLAYPRALATVKSSGLEVEGFARRHLTVCGSAGSLTIEPLDNPRIRLAFDRPRGAYQAAYQTLDLPRYERYVDDARDMAAVIRGDKPSDFSYAHDLTVQECVLRASGMPLDV